MPTVERDGARVHYEVLGAGPTLILGHSLLFDGRMWNDVLPALSSRFRLLNVDARGHRHSTAPARFTLDDLAADWLAILDQEKVERALLCGLSMGGMTAMRVALRAPERVAAMALLDTSADAEAPAHRTVYRVLAELRRLVRADGLIRPVVARKMFGKTTRRERPEIVARGMACVAEKEPRDLYPAIRAVFDRPSIIDRLREVTCPTLVMVGEQDEATGPSRSRRIAARVPGASLEVIGRAGHITPMEQPAEVSGILIDFLTRHASRAS